MYLAMVRPSLEDFAFQLWTIAANERHNSTEKIYQHMVDYCGIGGTYIGVNDRERACDVISKYKSSWKNLEGTAKILLDIFYPLSNIPGW